MLRIAKMSFLAHQVRHDQIIKEKGISNNYCYEMLTMPKYQELLSYVPVHKRNKEFWCGNFNEVYYKASNNLRGYVDYPFTLIN